MYSCKIVGLVLVRHAVTLSLFLASSWSFPLAKHDDISFSACCHLYFEFQRNSVQVKTPLITCQVLCNIWHSRMHNTITQHYVTWNVCNICQFFLLTYCPCFIEQNNQFVTCMTQIQMRWQISFNYFTMIM